MITKLKDLYAWAGSKTQTPYGVPLLFTLFFLESFILLMPVDPLLILFCLQNQRRSWYYASIATVASTLGGLTGFIIGGLLWHQVGQHLVCLLLKPATFDYARQTYAHYQHWAVLIAGFTPLPYKAVTLSAGFCQLPLLPFLACSFISRGARFFLVAGVLHRWATPLKLFIDRYFTLLLVLVLVTIAAGSLVLFY